MSATIPLEVMTVCSVSLEVLEYSLERMLYPVEIRISAATKQKSFPAIAKLINLVNNRWISTNSGPVVILVRFELRVMLNWFAIYLACLGREARSFGLECLSLFIC